MSSYYGWRDIGLGPRRTGPEINIIIGNSTNNEGSRAPSDIAKDYCRYDGTKLIYSDKIKKWFCSICGADLTYEERSKLFANTSSSSSSSSPTTPNATSSAAPSSFFLLFALQVRV
jgi:hypothetical protein